MKIFDATTIIAFLSEMDCPEGIITLSKHHKIIIPEAVAGEIKKSPGKERLRKLAEQKVVEIVKIDQTMVEQILREYPQLHKGECEAIAYMQSHFREKKDCIVSDDLKARKIFKTLNFQWTREMLDAMRAEGTIDHIHN